jgi:hypothetical protein
MADQEGAPPAAAAASCRLLTFWTDSTNGWFAMSEAQFRLRGLLLAALPREALQMVAHLVEREDEDEEEDRYAQLKEALISSHVMSDYSRVELLSGVEPLGGRRPSELLATMLEICPRGQEA